MDSGVPLVLRQINGRWPFFKARTADLSCTPTHVCADFPSHSCAWQHVTSYLFEVSIYHRTMVSRSEKHVNLQLQTFISYKSLYMGLWFQFFLLFHGLVSCDLKNNSCFFQNSLTFFFTFWETIRSFKPRGHALGAMKTGRGNCTTTMGRGFVGLGTNSSEAVRRWHGWCLFNGNLKTKKNDKVFVLMFKTLTWVFVLKPVKTMDLRIDFPWHLWQLFFPHGTNHVGWGTC